MKHFSRTARIAVGLSAGAVLALAVPLAASAHVEVSPDTAPAGATSALTFSFSHGCDHSPTTALQITIPKGVGNVAPVVEGGWSIERTLGADDVPTEVTFTADKPIESGLAASVSMDVLLDSSTQGTTIAFPVLQKCVTGSTSWSQVPKAGQSAESLDTPAPAVTVGTALPAGEVSDSDTVVPPAQPAQPDVAARWLGAGGLVAGIVAIAIATVGAVRRRVPRG